MKQNPKTILLAEDERVVALSLSMALKSLGYDVLKSVSRGKELVEEARKSHPDIIVSDIRLKDNITGIDAVKKIRKEFNPITIFITGYGDAKTRIEIEEANPDGFLIKPCTALQISKAIEKSRHIKTKAPVIEKDAG